MGPIWLFPVILAAENIVAVQLPHPWYRFYLYRGAPILFGLALLFFGRKTLAVFVTHKLSFSRIAFGGHVAAFAAFLLLELFLGHAYTVLAPVTRETTVVLCLALIPVLVALLVAAFVPLSHLRGLVRALGPAWGYAAALTLFVVILREMLRLSWASSSSRVGLLVQNASFREASALLRIFFPDVVSIPAPHILGTSRFLVIISGVCSGIEGLALISAFLLVWFIFARHEVRIGRALLLVPLALGFMWVFNLVRLVALIAIGTAGHPEIALNGFHTEAGWIALNVVSLGFLFAAQQSPWLRKDTPAYADALVPRALGNRDAVRPLRNVAAVYLAPFLAITAASLISQAASSSFEWLYPLRLFAVLPVFWLFREEYRRMNWRSSWLGPIAGLGIAVLWIGVHVVIAGWKVPSAGPGATLAGGLAALPSGERIPWISLRFFAAVVTVPAAEELAFRGFVARRLVCAEVETVSYARLTFFAILGSAVVFGAMHGRLWVPGIVAGIVYALVAKQRNRLGEAVAAHATSNLAIALFVLLRGDYRLW